MIIDSGNLENIALKNFVCKLGLKTEKHPFSYKIGWIKKGMKTLVTQQCRITFSMCKCYVDEVVCDVVEMDVCHFFFFFWISNLRILLIIEKVPSPVHWGCTMGAQIRKQKYNGQEK